MHNSLPCRKGQLAAPSHVEKGRTTEEVLADLATGRLASAFIRVRTTPSYVEKGSLLHQPFHVLPHHNTPRTVIWSADGLPPLSSRSAQLPPMSKRAACRPNLSTFPPSLIRNYTVVEQASFAPPSHAKELTHPPQSGGKPSALQKINRRGWRFSIRFPVLSYGIFSPLASRTSPSS